MNLTQGSTVPVSVTAGVWPFWAIYGETSHRFSDQIWVSGLGCSVSPEKLLLSRTLQLRLAHYRCLQNRACLGQVSSALLTLNTEV